MNTYKAYKNKEFDLSAFGLDRCGRDYTYFCTPVGADVFASPTLLCPLHPIFYNQTLLLPSFQK